jgi:hypothetical protein
MKLCMEDDFFRIYVQLIEVGRVNALSNTKTSCDLNFGQERDRQI